MVVSVSDKIKFIQSVFGTGRMSRAGTNIDIWCPICAPSDRSKKKLSIRLSDDANHCWTCDWKSRSLAPLIRRFADREKLVEYRDKFMVGSGKQFIDDGPPEQSKLKLPDDFTLLSLANTNDPDVKAAWRYVLGRGLTERDVWYFRLGLSDDPRWRRRVIVPSFDAQGELNYFVGRAIDKQRKPKYDNPDYDKLSIVFNEMNIDWTQRLTLCEGAFDMMKCGENTAPLLGSSLNEESVLFNNIIANSTPIALALDADMLHKRVYPIAEKLVEYNVDVVVVDVRPFPDPGKMSKTEYGEAASRARPYSWSDSFSIRLHNAARTPLRL